METVIKTNLETAEIRNVAIYNNGKLAFLDDLQNIDATKVIMEIYAVVLVLEGKASLNINGTPYVVHKNDIFICPPNNILENYLQSIDFKCYCICMGPEYVQQIVPMADNIWDIKILFEKNPVCTLQPNEVAEFQQYYDLLYSKIRQQSVTQEKIINAIMQAFTYDMQNILGRVIRTTPRAFTSGEFLFKRFIGLLESSYPKSRSVSYYAEHLHVTPKYLSTICKEISKQTASCLIDRYVLKDIEYLMKHSSKTIKEIVNDLDFPNISFFGKYVKRHFGMPPKTLREKFRQEYNGDTDANNIPEKDN